MGHARAEDRKAYAAQRRARVRRELVERRGGKCAVCGSAEGLKFSPVDLAAQRFTIDGSLNRPREVLEAEADKCRLLCAEHYQLPWHQAAPRGARHHAHGEDAAGALLTASEALAIRESPDSERVLADRYAVSKSTVHDIKSGRTWKCLP